MIWSSESLTAAAELEHGLTAMDRRLSGIEDRLGLVEEGLQEFQKVAEESREEMRSQFATILKILGSTVSPPSSQIKPPVSKSHANLVLPTSSPPSRQPQTIEDSTISPQKDLYDSVLVKTTNHQKKDDNVSDALASTIATRETYLTTIELPIFDGNDADTWLNLVECFFLGGNNTNAEKFKLLSMGLSGKVLSWFNGEIRLIPFQDWLNFKSTLWLRSCCNCSLLPTERESYVRLGGVMLTIFLRQDKVFWEELCFDLSFSLRKLLDLSDDPLWTDGWIYLRVQNYLAFAVDGQVVLDTYLPLRSHDDSQIITVRPLAVARKAQFTVKGINLRRPGTSLLCSVEGSYLVQEATQGVIEMRDNLKKENENDFLEFSCEVPIVSGWLLNILFEGGIIDPSLETVLLELCLLHRTVMKNSKPLVEILLRFILNKKKQALTSLFRPDATGPGGLTPLHFAVVKVWSEDVLDALTEDPGKIGIQAWKNCKDNTGFTPEDYVRLRGHFSYIHRVQRKLNRKPINEGHVVVNISESFNIDHKQEKRSLVNSSRLEITQCNQCKVCDHKLAFVITQQKSVEYRPALLSMVAIAAVCVCVALLFKRLSDTISSLQACGQACSKSGVIDMPWNAIIWKKKTRLRMKSRPKITTTVD